MTKGLKNNKWGEEMREGNIGVGLRGTNYYV